MIFYTVSELLIYLIKPVNMSDNGSLFEKQD